MRGKPQIVLLVALMLSVLAGTGQASLILHGHSSLTVQAQNGSDDTWNLWNLIKGHKVEWNQGYENHEAGPNLYDHIQLSYLGDCSIDVDAIRVDTGNGTDNGGAAPVPEPGTMLLLGAGLVGLASLGRKKFRK